MGEGWGWGAGKGWGYLDEDSEGQQLKQQAEGLVRQPGRRLQRGRAACSVRR